MKKLLDFLNKLVNWLNKIVETFPLKSHTEFITGAYSELIEKFPLKENLTDDDIIQISHKQLDNDAYTTTFITLKQLKDFLNK